MAGYQEVTLKAKFSDSSSLLPAVAEFNPDAYNPGAGTYRVMVLEIRADSAGTTIGLGAFTTVTQILIKNKDATNYTTATFRTTGGGANDQVLNIPVGSFVATGSLITVASDLVLTGNGADTNCLVCIIGTMT
jgi:hypothetical protein